MSERSRHAAEVQNIVTEWFRLMRAQDAEGLQTFLQRHQVSDDPLSDEMWVRHYTQSGESPYAALFGAAEPPVIQYFQSGGVSYDDYQAYGCVCKSGDCEGVWPIHS